MHRNLGRCSVVVLLLPKNPSRSPTPEPSAHFPYVYCPPAYDAQKTDYVVGDTVTIDSYVFECRSGPSDDEFRMYEPYCNLAVSTGLNDDEKALWRDAWAPVSACHMNEGPVNDAADAVTPLPTPPPTTPKPVIRFVCAESYADFAETCLDKTPCHADYTCDNGLSCHLINCRVCPDITCADEDSTPSATDLTSSTTVSPSDLPTPVSSS